MIIGQKICDLSHRFFQHFQTRQIYHAEMIRLVPVESTSMDQQDFLIFQQIQHKFLIVCDTELPDVQLREDIKAAFGFTAVIPGISVNA